MADDIVHAFLRRLAQWAPPAEVQQAELEFRQQWGGERHYIKAPPVPKVRMCAESLAGGATILEASRRAGVSLSTGYRLARRVWRCR